MRDFFAFIRRCLQHLWRGLIFLPQVIPFALPAQPGIFPWALLWSLHKGNRIHLWMSLFFGYITVNAVITYVLGISPSGADTLRSYVAIWNAVLAFGAVAFLTSSMARTLDHTAIVILCLCVLVAGFQFGDVMPEPITEFLQAWIPHFKGSSWGGERGVASLFTEPAFAGSALQIMFAYIFWKFRLNLGHRMPACMMLLGAFQVLVIKSFVGVMLFGLWVIYWVICGAFKQGIPGLRLGKDICLKFWPKAVGAVLFCAIAWLVWTKMTAKPRALQLLYEVWHTGNFREAGEILAFQSGFRWTGWLAAVRYGFEHPWGCGLGAWREASLQSLSANGLNVWPLHLAYQFYGGDHLGFRPTSLVSGLMLETGWIGVALLGTAMQGFLRQIWIKGEEHARALLLLCVTIIIMVGYLGDPIPWLVLGMLYQGVKANLPLSTEIKSSCEFQDYTQDKADVLDAKDLVSIVMPCYQSEATMLESIQGILDQTYPYWELLLMIDGPLRSGPQGFSEDTMDFLKDWKARFPDPRIRWIYSARNRGLIRARNLGIRLSGGAWIAFCDADDVWHQNKLQRQFIAAQLGGGTLWLTGFDYRRDDAKSGLPRFKKAMLPIHPRPGLMAYTNFVGLSTAVFRRELGHLPYFHDAPQGIIHEDYGFWLRYIQDFKPVLSYTPESLVQIRLRAKSRSSNKIQAVRSHAYWLWLHLSTSPWPRLRWLIGLLAYVNWALYKGSGTWRMSAS